VQRCVKQKPHTIIAGSSLAALPQRWLGARNNLFSLVFSVLFIIPSTIMEPLGAVADIATLLELVHKITVLCINACVSIINAMPDLIRFVDDVGSLRDILEGLLDLASGDTLQRASRLRHLDAFVSSNGPFKSCLREL
jgi:hypothetical protein